MAASTTQPAVAEEKPTQPLIALPFLVLSLRPVPQRSLLNAGWLEGM